MRKVFFYTLTICLLSTFSIADVNAVNNPDAIVATKPAEAEAVQAMIDRIHEIKKMDVSALSSTERKALKKEVKAIKHELKAVNGVYLSIGAILIIVLLLILLL